MKIGNRDFMEATCKCTMQLIHKGQEISQESTLDPYNRSHPAKRGSTAAEKILFTFERDACTIYDKEDKFLIITNIIN